MKFNQEKVKSNNITINTIIEGEGTPVVLVHGWPESWYSWRHQIIPFIESGFKVIIPDVRGYGNSEKPNNITDYSMKELTNDIVGILDFLQEDKAHIIGHDWGAPISWYTSLLHPERIISVSGLSVPYSFMGKDTKPTEFFKKIYKDNFFYMLYFQEENKAEKELERDLDFTLRSIFSNSDYEGMIKNIENNIKSSKIKSKNEGFLDGLSLNTKLPQWLNEKDLEYYIKQFSKSGMRGPLNRYRCIDLDWNELKNFSESKIEKPACFITGDLDPVNFFIPDNELFNTIDKHYTDLRVKKLIHKCGHWTQQEKPKEVNEILLDFLKKI